MNAMHTEKLGGVMSSVMPQSKFLCYIYIKAGSSRIVEETTVSRENSVCTI